MNICLGFTRCCCHWFCFLLAKTTTRSIQHLSMEVHGWAINWMSTKSLTINTAANNRIDKPPELKIIIVIVMFFQFDWLTLTLDELFCTQHFVVMICTQIWTHQPSLKCILLSFHLTNIFQLCKQQYSNPSQWMLFRAECYVILVV